MLFWTQIKNHSSIILKSPCITQVMNPSRDSNDDAEYKVYYHGEKSDDEESTSGSLANDLCLPKSLWILSDTKTEFSTVTELSSPKLKLPRLSNDTAERVFPIRSVISFDSAPSSALQTPSLENQGAFESPFAEECGPNEFVEGYTGALPTRTGKDNEIEADLSPRRPNHLLRLHQQTSYSRLSASPLTEYTSCSGILATGRNKRPSLPIQLQNTIREGAQLLRTKGPTPADQEKYPPTIHNFGALLIAHVTESRVDVQVASGNSADILGYSPGELFKLQSLYNIMPGIETENFRFHTETVMSDDYNVESMGPEVFALDIIDRSGDTRHLWCFMHATQMLQDQVICEIEPRSTIPESNIQSNDSSVSNVSPKTKTSPFIRSDHPSIRHMHGPPTSEHVLNAVPGISRAISSAMSLEELLNHTTSILVQLTLFSRVTIYHFDSDRNGVVVADSVCPTSRGDSCEGLHFPESSFSYDLKELYLRNKVTLAYKARERGAQLIYRDSGMKADFDLSNCYLIQPPEMDSQPEIYACLSIGLYVFGKLWGLIVCHADREDVHVHPLTQRICWFISEIVSSNIERLSYTLPFQFKEQPAENGVGVHQGQEIQTPSGDLLSIFGADYAVASILNESKVMGKPSEYQEILALLEYFRVKELGTIIWSTDIVADFEDLDYAPGFGSLSSLLYIPLLHDGHDFIVFFHEKAKGADSMPKKESDRHMDWSAADFGKASMLSLLYRTFTDVWQENEATMQNNQLMRLLLANSAHEFRTPLNAIINYLEIALDGNINQETRENLSRSHSASKSLIYIINDLLDLTNAENGQILIKDEIFNLSGTLSEATHIFWEEARQKDVDIQVVQHSTLPAVLGDQRRVRQVITNLISNAVQHTSHGAVTIESCVLSGCWEPDHIAVEVAIHDTGSGMSQDAAEALFCELEQVSNKDYMQKAKNHGSTSPILETESVLGLGLALVARIVRNMDGQLSLKSEEGKGSCFKIRLKFPIPPDDNGIKDPACDLSCDKQNDKCGTPCDVPIKHDDHSKTVKGAASEAVCDAFQETDRSNEKFAGIPCTCGDEIFPSSKHVEVDIELKDGESRNLTISDTGTDKSSPGTTKAQRKSSDINKEENRQLTLRQPDEGDSNAEIELEQSPNIPKEKTPAPEAPPCAKCRDSIPSSISLEKPDQRIDASTKQLHVLVAEDDPINSAIVKKRLEKFGYSIRMSGNGKECASIYCEDPDSFDVILMDLQVCILRDRGFSTLTDLTRCQSSTGLEPRK